MAAAYPDQPFPTLEQTLDEVAVILSDNKALQNSVDYWRAECMKKT